MPLLLPAVFRRRLTPALSIGAPVKSEAAADPPMLPAPILEGPAYILSAAAAM